MNDTNLRTIDKCDDNCKTCIDNATYCTSCKDDMPYLYLHKCKYSCLYGYYNDTDGILKCQCEIEKCSICSEESLYPDLLCEECNDGYYQKYNEKYDNNFVNCYKEPLEKYYLDSNISKFKPCYSSCKYCYKDGDKYNHFCSSCNLKNNYSILMEDYDNNTNYLNCYPECRFNYYFDEDYNYRCLTNSGCPPELRLLIENTKQCVSSCNETDYKYEFRNTCFKSCPPQSKSFYNSSGYYCKSLCSLEFPFKMIELQMCVSNCGIMDRYYKKCVTNYEANTTEEIKEIQDMILSDIQYDIINTFDYNFIVNNQNQSLVIEEDDIIYEIITTNSTYRNPNTSVIILGDCEPTLKNYYGIKENEPLYIFKVDAYVEGKVGPKVEYEIYYPFDRIFLHQLDLSICDGIDIYVGFPLNFTIDNVDLYNKDSAYYNDICYPYTNENGADVNMEDRHNEFKSNDRNLCEEDCKFEGIDEKTGIVQCSCQVKFSLTMISEVKIDKDKLYKYMNIKQIANFKILKCYKLLFSLKDIKLNIGFYAFIPTIIVYLICLLDFCCREFKLIKIQMNKIVFAKKLIAFIDSKKGKKGTIFQTFVHKKKLQLFIDNYNKNKKNNNKNNIYQNKDEPIKIKTINKYIKLDNNDDIIDDNNIDINNIDNNNLKSQKQNIFSSLKKAENKKSVSFNFTPNSFPPKRNSDKNRTNTNNNRNLQNLNNIDNVDDDEHFPGTRDYFFKMKSTITKNFHNEKYLDKLKIQLQNILKYNDTELNNFGYKKALKYDDRNYLQYYFSLIKTKHILFKIFTCNDYNPLWIKILLLFLNFSSCYAVNALFFNDDTMHQIYEDRGYYNLIYQLPQIIYSTFISLILDAIINSLALPQDSLLEIKSDKSLRNLAIRAEIMKESIKYKALAFFFFGLIYISAFYYYLGYFCAVYKNTQFHLIKDTLISYGTGFLTPFGFYLLPGIFRIPSLQGYSLFKRTMFKFSVFIQFFC